MTQGFSERQTMLEKLRAYHRNGCEIAVGGKVCYPQTAVNAYFREGCVYMPDYICDETDVIRRIDFIRIRGESSLHR